MSSPTVTQRFLAPIKSNPKTVLLLYFLLFSACLSWPTRNFTPNTDSSFVAPTDSMSGDAADRYNQLYGGDGGMSMVVLLQSRNATEKVTTNQNAMQFVSDLKEYSDSISSSCSRKSDIIDYYSLSASYADVAAALVNPTATSTIVEISYTCELSTDYVENMKDFVVDNPSYPEFNQEVNVGITGIELFQFDILDGVEADLSRMDTTILPLALLTLAFVLGSVPIMTIPIVNILLTITIAFAVMCPFALSMQVVSFTPSVMMSLVIAMSVDYSLFLLSRVQDEIASGTEKEQAIENMVEHAGHTIVASGSTLCVCFAGMLFFPMEMLRSVGIGATVSILTALFVNLTMTPAFLYTSAGTYCLEPRGVWAKVCCSENGSSRGVGSMLKKLEREEEEMGELGKSLIEGEGVQGGKTRKERYRELDEKLMYESLWYRLCSKLLDRRIGVPVLLVVVGLMVPVSINFVKLKTSIGFDLLLPGSAPSLETFDAMGDAFGPGTLSPYKVMFDTTELNATIADNVEARRLGTVGTQEAFDVMHDVLGRLSNLTATDSLTYFNGIAVAGGIEVTYSQYAEAHVYGELCGPNGSNPDGAACQAINGQMSQSAIDAANSLYFLSTTINNGLHKPNATYTTAILNVDPFSNDGTDWLVDARDLISSMKSEGSLHGVEVYFVDGAGIEYDAVKQVYDVFPVLITATLATVFVLMGAFFRSVVVPIRSVVSIALTLMFVFGLTVLVYQDGIFDPLGLACMSKTGEISWLPPVMTFSIVVGLGLDYDVFLISRVLEFREEGYSDDSSVLAGVWKTGSVITCAGIIMALAFAGLLMSEELLLNQTAFILVVSVLVDTFVVRTVLVPILLGVTRTQSWWPKALPEIRVDLEQRRKEMSDEKNGIAGGQGESVFVSA